MFNDENLLKSKNVKDCFKDYSNYIEKITDKSIKNSSYTKDSETGMFLYNMLEKIDPVIHKPLYRFFYSKFMPIAYGGGALEFSSFFRGNYFTEDAGGFGTSGQNNIISKVQVTLEKYRTIVKPYAWSFGLGWIDEMKLNQVGSDILTRLDEGVRLYYNQKLDDVAFYGFVKEGISDAYGLINNPNITALTSDIDFTEETTTPDQIVYQLNTLLYSIVANSSYSEEYRTNHIGLPPSIYSVLVQPMVIGSGEGKVGIYTNILEYFKQNNYVKSFFGEDDIIILPLPYLETAGAEDSRRIVAYCYDENCIRMPLPMDLTRGPTMFDPSAMETKTVFVTFIGHPQFVYTKTMAYLDKV